MNRRTLLQGTAAALAAHTLARPAIAQSASNQVLRFVPRTDLSVLDPIWTTTYPTRDHGFLVFDTLFGMDGAYRAVPQMLEAASQDGLVWTLRLRDGLRFHDGEPVLARDCAESIRRWGKRDAFGQSLIAATDEIAAPDDRTVRIRLRHPFPLPDALAKVSASPCFIMPERLAKTDAAKQVTEMVGSGPYRFIAAERVAGSRVAYEKFDGYKPRADGPVEWTAGPKVARFQRIEWHIIPDAATIAAALQRGEVDYWLGPEPDLLPLLRRDKAVVVRQLDPTGYMGNMRFNQLQPPFDNPAIRRAVLRAVNQADYMQAVAGTDPAMWRAGVGTFCPGTPMANDAGMQALLSPRDLDAAKRELRAAGYKDEPVVMLGGMDIPIIRALSEVSADLFKKLGFNLDFQAIDWPTVVARRVKKDPVSQGGWSVFHTWFAGLDQMTPAVHSFLRGNGDKAAVGWPTSPEIERLRDEWLRADTLAGQQEIARKLQVQAFQDVPYVPLGQQRNNSAYRADLQGMVEGVPVFWNVHRA